VTVALKWTVGKEPLNSIIGSHDLLSGPCIPL